MKKRILFVDDELFILAGLKRTLTALAPQYDFDFAGSGKEALVKLKAHFFDVIVTDIKMPQMTGDQLLTDVARLSPSTARVILSGEVNEETAKKVTTLAHSFLAKPCETEEILKILERLCSASKRLSNGQVQGMLRSIKSLPTPPALYFELQKKMQEEASLKDIAALISHDTALSGKILKVVNSSFFAIGRRIGKIEEAVMFLGVNVVRSLILSCHISATDSQNRIPGFSLDELNHHSILCSTFAMRLVKEATQSKSLSEEAFTLGVLHDVGILVMAEHMPDTLKTILQHMKENQSVFLDSELKCLGATHAQIGACLLEMWGLPDTLVDAIHAHHAPLQIHDLETLSPSFAIRWVELFLKGQSHLHWMETDSQKSIPPEIQRHPSFEKWENLCHSIFQTLQMPNKGQ